MELSKLFLRFHLVVGLPNNSTIALGDSVSLQAITNRFPRTIKWTPTNDLSCPDCLTPIASPVNTTEYRIEVQDSLGCMTSGTVKVSVDKTKIAFIPNAFSPNGDGQNDFFQIYPTNAVESIKVFQIFSEWGELIYESAEPLLNTASWDGTFRQQQAAIGTYVYLVQLQLKDQRLTTLRLAAKFTLTDRTELFKIKTLNLRILLVCLYASFARF